MWQPSALHLIMNCCIILHNMIIKDEAEDAQLLEGFQLPPPLLERPGDRFTDFLAQRSNYQDREAHYDLRNNLIEHLWAKYGRDDVEDEESDSD